MPPTTYIPPTEAAEDEYAELVVTVASNLTPPADYSNILALAGRSLEELRADEKLCRDRIELLRDVEKIPAKRAEVEAAKKAVRDLKKELEDHEKRIKAALKEPERKLRILEATLDSLHDSKFGLRTTAPAWLKELIEQHGFKGIYGALLNSPFPSRKDY
jgi:chromosome segregation ATPase